ncbi:MAG: methylated-DNA--[protein]-cysteine S-methyltransferase [Bdellovibrionaceae bacterium]|nr:methylated-DNA--[protein]-cysteine S-methyltransferase [Pseudobdellovibrionaceae bacterium]
MKIAQFLMKTPVGTLSLIATDRGLRALTGAADPDVPMVDSLQSPQPAARILAHAARELEEYFRGERTEFSVPLDIEGTDFQKKVWSELRQIPYGATWSYKQLALRVKDEKACRAVGAANGKNRLYIVIPCHRVIAGNGALTGYAGGLEMKARLLALEQRPRPSFPF